MDAKAICIATIENFGHVVDKIPETAWTNPTPCTEWDVRAVVNHVTSEVCWIPEILGGRTIAEVGTKYDGDVLGHNPSKAWHEAADRAKSAILAIDDLRVMVHLSFGDTSAEEYLKQMIIDGVIHSWDAATGAGLDNDLPNDLVDVAFELFSLQAEAWRQGGAVGPIVAVPDNADNQAKLLGLAGRDPNFSS